MELGWLGLLTRARMAAGLSQQELARRARTSRPTVSAYEHGRKAPSADTLERLLAAAGMRLDVGPVLSWRQVPVERRRSCWVADALWRLPPEAAFADVRLPLEVNWSAPGRVYRMGDRRQRARLYEVVLREGEPAELERYVDGVLLVDLWPELVLPRAVRAAWQPLIDAVLPRRESGLPADSGTDVGVAS